MLGRTRRSQRGHRIFDAMLMQHNDVHITFHHQHATLVANRRARLRQAIELAPFFKNRRLGRIQIFGLTLAHHATAKTNYLIALIDDRKHHPIAKAIIFALGFFFFDHQTRFDQLRIPVVIRKDLFQRLPVIPARGITETKTRGDLTRHAATFEVSDCLRRIFQLRTVKVARLFQRIKKTGGSLVFRSRIPLFHRHLHADRFGQRAHSIRKRNRLVFHHKAHRRTMRAASETVIELLGRTHGERGRFFLVKRAAGLIVLAGFLERQIALHHINNVNAIE